MKPKNYLATVCRIKPKDNSEYQALKYMCRSSKDIYNMGLYTCRQHFFKQRSFLRYEEVYKIVKDDYPDYRNLHSQAAQQTLMKVHDDMISFFNNRRTAKDLNSVRIPGYKEKEGFFNVYLSKDCFKVMGDKVRISFSKECKKLSGLKFLFVSIPEHLRSKRIKQLQIVPCDKGNWYKIVFTYLDEESYEQVSPAGALGIDLGVNNLVTMIDTTNSLTQIISGKKIKSINQWFNKKLSKIKALANKNLQKENNRRAERLSRKRSNILKDCFHKIAIAIIFYCLNNNISEIVIGKNKRWKQNVNMGKKNNQKFVNIPHQKLIAYLKYRASRHGIKVIEQEESYTSKCDALALEELKEHKSYAGSRTQRGLFRSSLGFLINADVNGAINILRKCKGEVLDDWVKLLVCRGHVYRPKKLHIAGS